MGTELHPCFIHRRRGPRQPRVPAAFDRIKALDATLTDYDPDSELMRLCDRAGGPPVAVGPDLFAVLARAKELYDRSGGAFDPSIAPVVRLWRRARRERKLPDPALLAQARALVGGRRDPARPGRRTVELARPGMKLDLGGIAKGYASGEAIAVLRREGIASALVAGSGDIVVSDPPPGRAGWTDRRRPARPSRRATGPEAGRSSSATPRSRPRATPSSSSRSTGSATPTSSTRPPAWA